MEEHQHLCKGVLKGGLCHAAWLTSRRVCKDRAAEMRAGDRQGNQNAALLQGQFPRRDPAMQCAGQLSRDKDAEGVALPPVDHRLPHSNLPACPPHCHTYFLPMM